jgi:hypothetical protein
MSYLKRLQIIQTDVDYSVLIRFIVKAK